MAKKKGRTLPFVVQPRLKPILERIGSEESGQIEIERRGFLSVAEKAWVQALEAEDDTQGRLHRLAIKIAAELDMDPKDALDLVASSEMRDERLDAYREELLATMQAMQQFGERRKIAAVTCLLINRLDPSWELEDSMDLHVDIIEGIYALYLEEEARSVAALEAALVEETGEKVKKGGKLGKE
tara:strand:- start:1163 stop:1714 length:552 start_codon:yes stop_codon:yes gene_type:complete